MATVLVIDDDAAMRKVLTKFLIIAGHSVITAENGAEGIKLYREHCPDLVITDLVMPDKDGLEVIMELCGCNCHAPIIAISGGGRCAAAGYLKMAHHLGADLTLCKPIGLHPFLAAVREVLKTAA